ncbi:hypothetical protein M9H77_11562 [Catharanthus roseus]|uniref:Uncharacterized protein n=1 Tax=Catharanthus roseus TaxID=4058 RepID=A0ACC0BF38_CATRO|nr:hypothetical protein M9H77_11562 [Catharanthus roseus]
MDSKTKDVVEDLRSHTTKFNNMHNPGLNEKASVNLSKEVKREHVHKRMEDEDSDFLKCLNTEYTSILDDPKPGVSIDCGDDPSYALFLSSLKNDGSSYVFEANEKIGLTKPLKYMENDPNGEDENDLDSFAKTEGIEFQNYETYTNVFFFRTITKHCYFWKDISQRVFGDASKERLELRLYFRTTVAASAEAPALGVAQLVFTWTLHHALRWDGRLVESQEGPKTEVGPRAHLVGAPISSEGSGAQEATEVQILEILRKPYDKEEHERLMQEITKRKPQHKHRDLRCGGNLTDDESFIPWNHKECVDVQPKGS